MLNINKTAWVINMWAMVFYITWQTSSSHRNFALLVAIALALTAMEKKNAPKE